MEDIEMTPDDGRTAALAEGPGQTIMASNQCGDFPFRLKKMMDPRTDVESIGDYDKDVVAYVGARTWNKFKYKNDYTNPSQLKFSNIKTPGPTYLVDTKWWLEYNVKIEFNNFPWSVTPASGLIGNKKKFMLEENIMELRPYPLHQCTDNIHLRLNNRDLISYPTQMLNQRMEYWQQDRLKESCGFCPHRKPNVQDTLYYQNKKNGGRSPYMNIGATYDGDFGNEVVFGTVTFTDSTAYTTATTSNGATPPTYQPYMKAKGTLTFTMREPVMAEPLDYFSSKSGSKTMNNITSIDLEYNFNNLRNMIKFNHAKLLEMAGTAATIKAEDSLEVGTKDYLTAYLTKHLETAMTISITDAWLVIDVATAQVEATLPYVTDYIEYRRYESSATEAVKALEAAGNRAKTYEIDSEIYSLTYMPNAIYLWVAPSDSYIYGGNDRCFYNNSYAQITGVEIDYGNLTKLGHKYTEEDLFLMALRNGLEDRTYADWTRTKTVFYHGTPDYTTKDKVIENCTEEFVGVGSVLRMIPGIDIVSGGEQTLIGGMKITNETIQIHVKYRPLNFFEDIKYSLYVAFEYNGICTLTPNFCDIAMIHIDSYNQIAMAEKAPRYKISRIYGKGLWDKTKKFFSRANEFAKKYKLVSRGLSMIPHPAAKAAAVVARRMGYGYYGGSTRMSGGQIIPPGSFYRTY